MDKIKRDIIFGMSPGASNNGGMNNITFCLTEECNLRCKYCYEVHKNNKRKMSFSVAKKVVDFVLSARNIYTREGVIWDFIGGEPLLEVELADQISEYIKIRLKELNHPWKNNYIFHFSTNGILYHTPKFQAYLAKNKGHVSVGMSVDGNKIKHDNQRVYKDGRGSYDDVIKNVGLWKKQFPDASTKATFSHDDIPYLKDSIVHLWNIGIKKVMANIVFEDVWDKNDPVIFENQLKELADYVIENEIWKDPEYTVKFFDPSVGLPLRKIDMYKRYCGAGIMLAVDCDGNFFPCIRFLNFTLANNSGYCIGNVDEGLNKDKLKAFNYLARENMTPKKCNSCEVASGCMNCVGFSYDDSEEGTIFHRTTYICDMHKANVRAIDYFWNKLDPLLNGLENPRKVEIDRANIKEIKHLIIYIDGSDVPYCIPGKISNEPNNLRMSQDMIEHAINFAKKNNLKPLFYHNGCLSDVIDSSSIDKPIVSVNVVDIKSFSEYQVSSSVVNLLIDRDNISSIFSAFNYLLSKNVSRINFILTDLNFWLDEHLSLYSEQLIKVAADIKSKNLPVTVNALHDVTVSERIYYGCDAGVNSYTLAPNGKLYICPSFYFEDAEKYSIGDLDNGFTFKYGESLRNSKFPECNGCKNYQCKRCLYLNKVMTNEYSISPDIQCKVSELEAKISKRFFEKKVLF